MRVLPDCMGMGFPYFVISEIQAVVWLPCSECHSILLYLLYEYNPCAVFSDSGIARPVGYCTSWMAGGCQLPLPAGRIEGASIFGQYRRKTI